MKKRLLIALLALLGLATCFVIIFVLRVVPEPTIEQPVQQPAEQPAAIAAPPTVGQTARTALPPVRQDEDSEADEGAEYYNMSPKEYHRVRMVTRGLGVPPNADGLNSYGGYKFVWREWRKDFDIKNAAKAAQELYAELKEKKVLSVAKPVIELIDFPVPPFASGDDCLTDPTFKWRVVVPVDSSVESVEAPLQLGSFPEYSVLTLVDPFVDDKDLSKLAVKLAQYSPNTTRYHIMIRYRELFKFNWKSAPGAVSDMMVLFPK